MEAAHICNCVASNCVARIDTDRFNLNFPLSQHDVAELRRKGMEEINGKRRKLDREKRNMDAPRPGEFASGSLQSSAPSAGLLTLLEPLSCSAPTLQCAATKSSRRSSSVSRTLRQKQRASPRWTARPESPVGAKLHARQRSLPSSEVTLPCPTFSRLKSSRRGVTSNGWASCGTICAWQPLRSAPRAAGCPRHPLPSLKT